MRGFHFPCCSKHFTEATMPESIFKNTACRLPPAHMRKQNKNLQHEYGEAHPTWAQSERTRTQMAGRENARKLKESVKDSTTEREREREERHASVITSHLYRWQLIRWAIVPRDGSQVTSTNTKTHKMKCVSCFPPAGHMMKRSSRMRKMCDEWDFY